MGEELGGCHPEKAMGHKRLSGDNIFNVGLQSQMVNISFKTHSINIYSEPISKLLKSFYRVGKCWRGKGERRGF